MISPPRIAVLIDLPRGASSGGHVKYWERIAQAAVAKNAPIDLTLYFSGDIEEVALSPCVRLRCLPPVFSTAKLKFLPYVPAHTDIAPFHPRLAKELAGYDVIHATDGFFAFARTAERVSRKYGIPLSTSFHTDTPAYAELFTRKTLEKLLGKKTGLWADRVFEIAKRECAKKSQRLAAHLGACSAALALRKEDIALAGGIIGAAKVSPMRIGVDKEIFMPRPEARAEIEKEYGIAPGKFVVLFVGRVDEGKNAHVLAQACAAAISAAVPLHLVAAGQGPLVGQIKDMLGDNVTFVGVVPAEKLARLYAAADCLAVASDVEIGGMIGLEAQACGCPVLASAHAGICGCPAAIRLVETGGWKKALADMAGDRTGLASMREEALAFRRDSMAGWDDILTEDFIPVWKTLAEASTNDVRQTHSDPRGSS